MEDKRTALAFFICVMIALVYSDYVFRPTQTPNGPTVQSSMSQQSGASPSDNGQTSTTTPSQLPGSPLEAQQAAISANTPPTREELQGLGVITVETPVLRVTISKLGARILSWQLKKYRDHLGAEDKLDMVRVSEGAPYPLGVHIGTFNDAHTIYSLEAIPQNVVQDRSTYLAPMEGKASFSFAALLPSGSEIRKVITFNSPNYDTEVHVSVNPPLETQGAAAAPIWIEWGSQMSDEDAHRKYNPEHFSALGSNNKLNHFPLSDSLTKGREYIANEWVAIADNYFLTALIPEVSGDNSEFGQQDKFYFIRAKGSTNLGNFTVYAGPKEKPALLASQHQLARSIDLGWFSWLAEPLLIALHFFYTWLGNYGLAIILLTLLIKALFLRLTQASFKSMKAMQDIQPEVTALKERVKDPTQLNQEILALYRKRGINPMGGCLPMVIQIPVFFGLYAALLNSIELRHAPFALWIHDLSAPEALMVFGMPVRAMVLMMGVSMWYQQWSSPPVGDPQQRKIMMMMPVVFTLMFYFAPVPAGLVLYWLINNVISIIQQNYMRGESKSSALQATVVASLGILLFGFVLTKIS